MKNKLEELKKVIQKSNTNILDLEIGCYILCDGVKLKNLYQDLYVNEEDGEMEEYCSPFDEIIGRDINLEDVLKAIKDKNSQLKMMFKSSGLNDNGEFLEYYHKSDTWTFKAIWTFNVPLHKQREYTINYLHSILCKK